ncbi:MAG: UDP-glucose/GDP-mannose dehydrogenase family protein [bacterium]|nr:UDP-glucose/GDP-mannose dehydrogenase family protein [bacterium]
MNICVVGTGYVGLVAGTCLSDFGMNVYCVDKDERKIELLKEGHSPIYEIGLSDMINHNFKLKRLHFTTDLNEAIDRSLVVFLAVGTPEGEDGRADLSQIFEVAKQVASRMTEYKVLVIKSTVPVGTAAKVREIVKENLTKPVDFDIVSNPEFLREGSALDDFLHPDRVVIGSDSERALAIIRDVYRPLYLIDTPFVSTNNATAELIKYAANTMLAVKISYVNEIANICGKIGAEIDTVTHAVGQDKRIGPHFLTPGPGYGGSCLPKDVAAIIDVADQMDYEFMLAKAATEVNRRQKKIMVERALEMVGSFAGKTIGMLGMAFKQNTDDCRESPAIEMSRRITEAGGIVRAYDPVAMDEAKKQLPDLVYCDDAYSAVEGSDLIIIATEWNEFQNLDFDRLKEIVKSPRVLDTRNIFDPRKVTEAGFEYQGSGRVL